MLSLLKLSSNSTTSNTSSSSSSNSNRQVLTRPACVLSASLLSKVPLLRACTDKDLRGLAKCSAEHVA